MHRKSRLLPALAAVVLPEHGLPPDGRHDPPRGPLAHGLTVFDGDLIGEEPAPELRVVPVGAEQGMRAIRLGHFGICDRRRCATDSRAGRRASTPDRSPRWECHRRQALLLAGRAFSRNACLGQVCRGSVEDLALLLEEPNLFA